MYDNLLSRYWWKLQDLFCFVFLNKKFEWKISGLKLHFEKKVTLDGIHATLFHYI